MKDKNTKVIKPDFTEKALNPGHPHCNYNEIQEFIRSCDWGNTKYKPLLDHVSKCPECKKIFLKQIMFEPVFTTKKEYDDHWKKVWENVS